METPLEHDMVLIGGGHSHVGVLKRFGQRPPAGVRLTLISRDRFTPYSGMLPGYIAGHYSYEDVHIDLARLARYAGARFHQDEAVGLDRDSRQVRRGAGEPVRYDTLSINTGSTPNLADVPGARDHAVPVKPIGGFNERWQALLVRVREHEGSLRIAVVGGGAGGVELALSMQYRLRRELLRLGRDPAGLEMHLITGGDSILPSHNSRVRRIFQRALESRGIIVHAADPVETLSRNQLHTRLGLNLEAEEIIWVTRAAGAPWMRDTGLALDDNGFLQVRDTLQTLTDDRIFAAGDVASMIHHPREKAGVFAVRMGPPLARNLRLAAQGKPLRAYRPQRRWLALISTGDRYAVASRGRLALEGGWVWRWKDWIDRRFMHAHTVSDRVDPGRP